MLGVVVVSGCLAYVMGRRLPLVPVLLALPCISEAALRARARDPAPDPYVGPLINSYQNPHATSLGGYMIEPTWGGNWALDVPGLEGKEWDEKKWAWVAKEGGPPPAPAPAPPPAAPAEPQGNPAPEPTIDCGKLKAMAEADYADAPAMECHGMGIRGGANPVATNPDCMCYAWTSNCPYETCQSSQVWEGKYCLADKVKKEFGITHLSKWSPMDGSVSLCGYWSSNGVTVHDALPIPAIDGAKWKTTQGLLLFQGLTLAGCYDATSAANYEATKKGLSDKLGLGDGLDIMYMVCAQGGASPEWKFLQLGAETHHRLAHNASQVPGGEALLQLGRQVVPCVFNPGSEGCPTMPPVMFPYTPTATLSVEISGLSDTIGKAQKENEDDKLCFDTPSKLQPQICVAWKSGEKCCEVAPVTPAPDLPTAYPGSYE